MLAHHGKMVIYILMRMTMRRTSHLDWRMELQNPFIDREVVPADRERSSIKPSALSLLVLLSDQLFRFLSLLSSRRSLCSRLRRRRVGWSSREKRNRSVDS